MDCEFEMDERAAEYLVRFRSKTVEQRVPVSGTFDLTYRCNLRCTHCYVGHLFSQSEAVADELESDQVLHLVREAADEGCLYLLLSGGEPLLRRDFTDIYVACRRMGLVVTVFTNATLVAAEHVAAFKEFPPHQVEVSLYGATETTYENVTGVPGSYARAMRGIELLLKSGVDVGLKTMMLRDNISEVLEMEALAASLGTSFRMDPLVTPRLDGGCAPLEQRIATDLAASVEFATEKRRAEWLAIEDRVRPTGGWDRVYRCGAGVTGFHLDPHGVLRPCLESQAMGFDAAAMGFGPAWRAAVAAVDSVTADEGRECADCPKIAVCGYCPGLFELETGSAEKPPGYVCALGASRSDAILAAMSKED